MATSRASQRVGGDVVRAASVDAVDTTSFDAFVSEHAPSLLRAGWLLTGERSAAEDLLQTTWSAVWPRWTSVAGMEFPLA